jgi:CoA:oxalate CoA-transferase
MTLNLKEQKGKDILKELVKQVDVIVENYRPGTMEKLGLGYDVLKEINPKIIYAASSGFGHTGPYSKRPAYDGVVQAMGGIMSITGQKGGKPTRVGPSVGDITAGLFTAIGILAALQTRNTQGVGQKVDVAMLDCQVAILENAIARYVVSGDVPAPAGNRHSSIVPFEPFETANGEIMIAAGNDNLYKKYCAAMGRPELAEDERFVTNPLRSDNYAELRPILGEAMKAKTTEEWQTIMGDAGVPNGPINTVDKVISNEQVNAREMIQEVEHPIAGKLKMPGVPIKMSETPGSIRTHAPLLGQHTNEVLSSMLGLSEEEIKELKDTKVL